MKGSGTRDALSSLQVLFHRSRDMNCNLYACFMNQKAVNKVQHNKMVEFLHDSGINGKDLCMIKNPYWNESTSEVNHEKAKKVKILRGCILSPLISNLYLETISQETLEHVKAGILLNGD